MSLFDILINKGVIIMDYKDVKNAKTCWKCGYINKPESNCCAACGKDLPDKRQTDKSKLGTAELTGIFWFFFISLEIKILLPIFFAILFWSSKKSDLRIFRIIGKIILKLTIAFTVLSLILFGMCIFSLG